MKSTLMKSITMVLSSTIFASTVAVVDLELLLNNTKSYLDAKTKLEAQVKREQISLESMGKDIEALNIKLEKNIKAMSADAVAAAKKDIADKQNAYATKQMTVQRELYKANQDALNAAFDTIRKAAAKVAKNKDLEVILPKSEAVFASTDITNDVKAALTEK